MKTPLLPAAMAAALATALPAQHQEEPVQRPVSTPATPAGHTAEPVGGAIQTLPNAPTKMGFGRVPIHTGEADLGHEYGIWAVGETYRRVQWVSASSRAGDALRDL